LRARPRDLSRSESTRPSVHPQKWARRCEFRFWLLCRDRRL